MSMALAFLRRDLLIWSSYRLSVVWQLLGIVAFVAMISVLGGGLGGSWDLRSGGSGSFVAFLLSGIAVTDFLSQGLYALPQAIRNNQKDGTLEPMLLTPVGAMALVMSSALFPILQALLRLVIYLTLGEIAFGFWHAMNFLSFTLVVALATTCFISLGALSAAFIVTLKQGDPIIVVYVAITSLLGGVLFPASVFPEWLRPATGLVPLTYALNGARAALDGATPAQVARPVIVLAAISAVLLPISVVVLNWAVNRAKREGSLGQY